MDGKRPHKKKKKTKPTAILMLVEEKGREGTLINPVIRAGRPCPRGYRVDQSLSRETRKLINKNDKNRRPWVACTNSLRDYYAPD